MRFPPSIERVGVGLLAMAALHGAVWALAGQGAAPLRGHAARPVELKVLEVRLLGDVSPAPRDTAALSLPGVQPGEPPLLPPPEIVMLAEVPEPVAAPLFVSAAADLPRPGEAPDRAALPLTAPDLSSLAQLSASGAPIRLRLQIGADGVVGVVEVLSCAPDDRQFAERLAAVLRATPHIPARQGGVDVASVKEIELAFGGRLAGTAAGG